MTSGGFWLFSPKAAQQPDAVEPRHIYIAQQHVEILFFEQFPRRFAVRSRIYFVTLPATYSFCTTRRRLFSSSTTRSFAISFTSRESLLSLGSFESFEKFLLLKLPSLYEPSRLIGKKNRESRSRADV
jgi:alpha-N-acetylglucosamine transferase